MVPDNTLRSVSLQEALERTKEDLEWMYRRKESGLPLGPKTGFDALDEYLGGYLRPGLHSLLGKTGMGKSMLAWQIAVQCGTPVLYVTTEISTNDIVLRHTALATDTVLGKLLGLKLSKEKMFGLIDRAAPSMEHIRIVDALGQQLSLDTMATEVRSIKDADDGIALVVLDSFHKWASRNGNGANEHEVINKAFLDLLGMADRERVPIIAIAEKSLGKSDDETAEAGAGSRRLAYDPVSVLNLNTDDKPLTHRPSVKASQKMRLIISKQRNGASKVEIPLYFNGALCRFSEEPVNYIDNDESTAADLSVLARELVGVSSSSLPSIDADEYEL